MSQPTSQPSNEQRAREIVKEWRNKSAPLSSPTQIDECLAFAIAAALTDVRREQREMMRRKIIELHHAICHSFINNDEINAYRMACEHFMDALQEADHAE